MDLHRQPGSKEEEEEEEEEDVYILLTLTLWHTLSHCVTHHVLVEGGLSLAACQREDWGRRQRAQMPQRQRWTSTTQLERAYTHTHTHRVRLCGKVKRHSECRSVCFLTIQSESVVRQLIHLPNWGRAQLWNTTNSNKLQLHMNTNTEEIEVQSKHNNTNCLFYQLSRHFYIITSFQFSVSSPRTCGPRCSEQTDPSCCLKDKVIIIKTVHRQQTCR